MRRLTTFFCAVGVTAGLAACAGQHKDTGDDQLNPEQQAAQEQQQAAQGTQSALQNFQENKRTYLDKSAQDLTQLDAKIAAFRAQSPADQTQKVAHDATINTLEDTMQQARKSYESLKSASLDNWDTKQRDFEQALLTTRAAYDASTSQMAH